MPNVLVPQNVAQQIPQIRWENRYMANREGKGFPLKNYAPIKCPMCGELYEWRYAGTERKGLSAGKAAIGGIAFGPVGLAAGALGKKKSTYVCGRCGFSRDYDAK